MKKKKSIVSLMVCLSLIFSMITPNILAKADTGSSSGMVINKTATANEDGSYTIQLEAYATGSKVITEVKEDIPTDIVLVLDQSGSMDDPIGTVSFTQYSNKQSTNSSHYSRRHNGGSSNLYYPLGDGSYTSVSMTIKEEETYTKIENGKNNSTNNGAINYYDNQNNLYALVSGEYQKVTVTYAYVKGQIQYTYTLPDDTIIAVSTGNRTSPSFENVDGNVLYLRSVDQNKTVYTYLYTDASGELQTIGTSTGANTVFGTTLYQKVIDSNAGGSRLVALQNALTTFTNSVKEKASGSDGVLGTADDVNHRIAVVGFATGDYSNNSNYPTYENTELFIGATQYNYNVNASSYYGSAFQEMSTTEGYNNVIASKNALAARGATYINYGLEMANAILEANPVPDGEKRNRVIVVFTDGQPGYSGYDQSVADSAITEATTAKNNGVTVYAVGIFSGADATSAGDSEGDNTEKANYFMQNLSSNNGVVQDPSYYLSAADADTLNNIFQQISDQIETGGSSTTLSEETVIKDIIAPQFTLPEGTNISDITLETYECTGKSGDSYTWKNNNDDKGATVAINGDQVSVTGFDFAENYVGTVTDNGNVSYQGNKLVISFDVIPKAGFLGGNNVYTNTLAGVYENSDATTPVLVFNRPQVNVPIDEVSVSVKDKNVYLLGEITAEQLKAGAEISVGDVELNLTANNYGLETWQNEYVDITITVKDASGNDVSDKLGSLEEDQKYYVYAAVAPKTNGDGASGTKATEQSNNDNALINVFKPELTYKDRTVYYGETVPTDLNKQLTSTIWKHTNTSGTVSQSTEVEMVGTRPELNLTYMAESEKIVDGKINSKQDIRVKATVEINSTDITSKTWFVHTACADSSECTWGSTTPDGDPAFLLHPETCSLTITKTGGIEGEPYVFTVKKDDAKYSEVTIVGNGSKTICELPVGTYTIEEDTSWSWRHNPTYGNAVVLSSTNANGTINCKNTQDKPYWLNGFSNVVENIFGRNK